MDHSRFPFRLSFALPEHLQDRLARLLTGPLDTPVTISGDRVECEIDEIAAIHLLAISGRARGVFSEWQTCGLIAMCDAATSETCDAFDDLLTQEPHP